MERHASVTA